jgi:effector-binding domain-containing protein
MARPYWLLPGGINTLKRITKLHRSPPPPHPISFRTSNAPEGDDMNLTEHPDEVNWPETHYVFVEKVGPFMNNAPQAWQEARAFIPALSANNKITGAMSLYKMEPQLYRAGFILAGSAVDIPAGLRYEKFPGGKYVRFVLKGPYTQLPEASGSAWKIVADKKIQLRDDYSIENYANDPGKTPEDQLITEIMFPIV